MSSNCSCSSDSSSSVNYCLGLAKPPTGDIATIFHTAPQLQLQLSRLLLQLSLLLLLQLSRLLQLLQLQQSQQEQWGSLFKVVTQDYSDAAIVAATTVALAAADAAAAAAVTAAAAAMTAAAAAAAAMAASAAASFSHLNSNF